MVVKKIKVSTLLIVNTCSPWWVVEPTWLSTRTPYYAWYTSLLIITTYGRPMSHILDVLMYYESSKILVFQTQNILKTSYVFQRNNNDHYIAVANFGFCSVDEWFNLHYNDVSCFTSRCLLISILMQFQTLFTVKVRYRIRCCHQSLPFHCDCLAMNWKCSIWFK